MSLSLLQGYSSAEEEAQEQEPHHAHLHYPHSSDDDDDDEDEASAARNHSVRRKSFVDLPQPSSVSGLPSALDVFSQVSGPPAFLNNSVEEYGSAKDVDQNEGRRSGRRNRKAKKDLPTGAVVEAKAQLVGIHERVRSDIEGNQPPASSASSTMQGSKRVATAANPNAEDAAELLRMCLQCGIPKTYSNARGMVCPVCGDRPPDDASNEPKKKGSFFFLICCPSSAFFICTGNAIFLENLCLSHHRWTIIRPMNRALRPKRDGIVSRHYGCIQGPVKQ